MRKSPARIVLSDFLADPFDARRHLSKETSSLSGMQNKAPFHQIPEMDRHRSSLCPETVTTCDDCSWQGKRPQKPDHVKACPEIKLTCDIPGCGASVKRRDMEDHLNQSARKHVELLLQRTTDEKHSLRRRRPQPDSVSVSSPPPFPGWQKCSTEPECPYSGWFDPDNPFGQRCVRCNRERKSRKVPCESGQSPWCWKQVTPHPHFGSTCKPCRDMNS